MCRYDTDGSGEVGPVEFIELMAAEFGHNLQALDVLREQGDDNEQVGSVFTRARDGMQWDDAM